MISDSKGFLIQKVPNPSVHNHASSKLKTSATDEPAMLGVAWRADAMRACTRSSLMRLSCFSASERGRSKRTRYRMRTYKLNKRACERKHEKLRSYIQREQIGCHTSTGTVHKPETKRCQRWCVNLRDTRCCYSKVREFAVRNMFEWTTSIWNWSVLIYQGHSTKFEFE